MKRTKVPRSVSRYNAGRKTYYNVGMNRLAYKLALLGATDKQIADILEIDINAFYSWKSEKPAFRNAIKRGKEVADAEIADAFFRVAKGGIVLKSVRKVWSEKRQEFMEEVSTREIPPNAFACQKWLALRQREKWTEIQKFDITNNVNVINMYEEKKLDSFSTEELEVLEQLGLKRQLFLKSNNN